MKSVCSDPTRLLYPQRSYCYVVAGAAQVMRETEKVYKHPEPTDPSPHVTDGLEWWLALDDLTPEDDFFGTGLLNGGVYQPPGDKGQTA